jgi:hypothetical protein
MVSAHAFNRVSFYGSPGDLLEQLTFFGGGDAIWAYDELGNRSPLESALELTANAQLRGGWKLRAHAERAGLRYEEDAFAGHALPGVPGPYAPVDLRGAGRFWIGGTTPAFKAFDVDAQLNWGRVAIFAEGSDGHETRLALLANLRAGGSLRAGARLALSRITRRRDGSEFARTLIPRLKVEYQPRRSLFVRAVAEYQALRRDALRDARTGALLSVDGVPQPREDAGALRVDLLLSYEPTPGTVAFVGYGSSLDDRDQFSDGALARQSDGFFLKLAYRFRR